VKLLNKTSLIIITITLFIFLLGGIGFFYLIRSMITRDIDRELVAYSDNLVTELIQIRILEKPVLITENNVSIERVPVLSDTVLMDLKTRRYYPHRMYRFYTQIETQPFRITVFRSTFNSEKLTERIIVSLTGMLVLFIIMLYFLNQYFFRRIWDDFFITIDNLRQFNLQTKPELLLTDSEIEEFKTLNEVINRMISRIRDDYSNLKEFTENISHELQTPLAIMRSKIEMILQQDHLSDHLAEEILSLYESVNRLSNMNKTLILLTRLDNHQFPELKKIRIDERILFHLENLQEHLASKEIEPKTEINEVEILANPELMDILILNLLKNAIRHNHNKGLINIILTNEKFLIANTGLESRIPNENIFTRYRKNSRSIESLGLGLAIVKKICDTNNYELTYDYQDNKHYFSVSFEKKTKNVKSTELLQNRGLFS
jgi:signal transduction histidine kinase